MAAHFFPPYPNCESDVLETERLPIYSPLRASSTACFTDAKKGSAFAFAGPFPARIPSFVGCALLGDSERKRHRLQIGQFEADLENQQLYKRGLPIRLENLPLLVLAALLERPGSAVSREELPLQSAGA